MRWIEAVKIWNTEHNKGKWCVPKKGSPEHSEVMKIMKAEKKVEKKPVPKAADMYRAKMERDKKVQEDIELGKRLQKESEEENKKAVAEMKKKTSEKIDQLRQRLKDKKFRERASQLPPELQREIASYILGKYAVKKGGEYSKMEELASNLAKVRAKDGAHLAQIKREIEGCEYFFKVGEDGKGKHLSGIQIFKLLGNYAAVKVFNKENSNYKSMIEGDIVSRPTGVFASAAYNDTEPDEIYEQSLKDIFHLMGIQVSIDSEDFWLSEREVVLRRYGKAIAKEVALQVEEGLDWVKENMDEEEDEDEVLEGYADYYNYIELKGFEPKNMGYKQVLFLMGIVLDYLTSSE